MYKYADDVHRIHMDMTTAEINPHIKIQHIMPKCPECDHVLELIGICDNGIKTPNNLYGYRYMYYFSFSLFLVGLLSLKRW